MPLNTISNFRKCPKMVNIPKMGYNIAVGKHLDL